MTALNIYYILGALLVFLVLYFIFLFNNLIKKRERVKEASSSIEVMLKMRADLIPNLLEIVKGYAAYEKEVLESITESRTKVLEARSVKEGLEANNMLTSALKTLFAVAENYPNLKANQNFLQLQKQLSDVEDKIQASRRFYNAVVQEYNSSLKLFPNSIVASVFGFKEEEYFELSPEEKKSIEKPPEVKF